MIQSPEQSICEAWEPISDKKGWEWVSENVSLGNDSELKNFEFELFPLARFVLDQLCHNELLQRFTEMLSAQVGKTVTILAYVCWKVINRPSSMAWYTDTGLNAKGDFKTKILPMFESCERVARLLPTERSKKEITLIQWPEMNFRVMGAESRRNREGKTISEVCCDEARNYPAGAMEQIDNRYKTVSRWRRILFSSAGLVTNEPWLSFKKGSRHLGFWKCPHCGHKQTFRFGHEDSPLYPEKRTIGGFIWEDNEQTHPQEDVWNFKDLDPTIRYQCENERCKHGFKESEKIGLIRSVVFEQTNPMADPGDVSVHCWEAYMPFAGCSWSSIVHKFLNAVVAMRQGNIEPMKVFRQETEGEPWEERGERPVEGDIVKRCGEYSVGEEYPPEIKCARTLSADMQHGYVRYNFSMFTTLGEKRTIEVGSVATLDELRLYQQAKKIKDRGVGVDCAWHGAEVFDACLQYGHWIPDPKGGKDHIWNGWNPLYGSDEEEFAYWTTDKNGVRIAIKSRFKPVLINAKEGRSGKSKPIYRFSWSGPSYKTELYFTCIKGAGPTWEIPKNISREYLKQMMAVERREVRDAEGTLRGHEWKERGRHDDSDLEQMQLVIRDINGIGK